MLQLLLDSSSAYLKEEFGRGWQGGCVLALTALPVAPETGRSVEEQRSVDRGQSTLFKA